VKEAVGENTVTVPLIDWANPQANDFAIAEEVTLLGHHERRPDIVLYINGIAIGVIGLKNSRVIARWEPRLGVEVRRVFVQRMKTKWGSCSPALRSIRLNTELAKKPRECLEYIVVHEMIHLLERTHGERFVSILDDCLPRWRQRRDSLNRLPVRHEHWSY